MRRVTSAIFGGMVYRVALIILLLMQVVDDLRATRLAVADRRAYLRTPLVRSLLRSGALLFAAAALARLGWGGGLLAGSRAALWAAAGAVSLGISYCWYRYIVRLDMFERERRRWLLLAFVLGCGTTLLVFPASDWIKAHTPLVLDGDHWNDWWYSVLAIGLVEETVKLLPYLVVLFATRQADEPFDHLLYGCMSALGFAFMENTLYLKDSGLTAFAGRAFTASVSHMFDTSIICYGIAMDIHRHGRARLWRIPLLLGLAALAHGFYDYWLLSPERPAMLTFFFFLGTMHLWAQMKNNLVNASPRYVQGAVAGNRTLRYGILTSFVALFAGAVALVLLLRGDGPARAFLVEGGWQMAGTLILLTMTFSGLDIVRGHVAPLRLPTDFRRWFLPRYETTHDLSGARIELKLGLHREPEGVERYIEGHLPLQGRLVERAALGGSTDWFVFVPERPMPLGEKYAADRFLVQLHSDHEHLPERDYARLFLRAVHAPVDGSTAVFPEERVAKQAFRVMGRRLG